MRLGAYECDLVPGSRVRQVYGAERIFERHRHRYEVNINYREALQGSGLMFAGMSPDGVLLGLVELPGHPWLVGVQLIGRASCREWGCVYVWVEGVSVRF